VRVHRSRGRSAAFPTAGTRASPAPEARQEDAGLLEQFRRAQERVLSESGGWVSVGEGPLARALCGAEGERGAVSDSGLTERPLVAARSSDADRRHRLRADSDRGSSFSRLEGMAESVGRTWVGRGEQAPAQGRLLSTSSCLERRGAHPDPAKFCSRVPPSEDSRLHLPP
jgi:hypothetical protein